MYFNFFESELQLLRQMLFDLSISVLTFLCIWQNDILLTKQTALVTAHIVYAEIYV